MTARRATSETVKSAQYNPPEIIETVSEYEWRVAGRDQDEYTVKRDESKLSHFVCTCKGSRKHGLCRHVQSVVSRLARKQGWEFVQFWRFEHEADRQNRRKLTLYASGIKFFVTYSWGSWVPRRSDARVHHVKYDQRIDAWDVWYTRTEGELAGFPFRRLVKRTEQDAHSAEREQRQ